MLKPCSIYDLKYHSRKKKLSNCNEKNLINPIPRIRPCTSPLSFLFEFRSSLIEFCAWFIALKISRPITMKKENIQTRNRKPNVRRSGKDKSEFNLQFASFLLKSEADTQNYMGHHHVQSSTAGSEAKYFNLAYHQFNHHAQQDFQPNGTQMVPTFTPNYHNHYNAAQHSNPNSFLAARNVAAVAAAAAAAATAAVNSTQFISQSQLSSSPLSTSSSSLLSTSISPGSAPTIPLATTTTTNTGHKQKQSTVNNQHPQIHHHHHHHHPTAFLNLSGTANPAVRDYDQISCY
jgi:hypothetical protein